MLSRKFIFLLVALTSPPGGAASSPSEHDHHAHHRSAESKELSREEYAAVKDEFIKLMNTHDPKFALTELRERTKTDNALVRSCHALVHDIGHAAYDRYGDFGEAMKYQDEMCNSGYIHGIIETHFSKNPNVLAAMKDVCRPYPVGKYLSWQCHHGVGHGVMYYTSNDLPKSLELCDKYEGSFARENCANGVFMETFNIEQKTRPSQSLEGRDAFHPCQEQTPRNKATCYFYAPARYLRVRNNDYAGALRWCDGAEPSYRDDCIQGVGSQATKENINNPKLVEAVCMRGRSSQVARCVSGLVGLYINHHGSLGPARELCERLEASNRPTCQRSIQSRASLF